MKRTTILRAAVAALLALLSLLSLVSLPARAQSEVSIPPLQQPAPSPTSAPPAPSGGSAVPMPAAGSTGEALSSTVQELMALRDGLLSGGVALSRTTAPEAGKFAWALAVITITIGGIRFMAHRHPVGAWVELLETLTILGIFSAIYLSFDSFGPGIFQWFDEIARAMSGGNYGTGSVLAYTAGKFLDSFVEAIKVASWYNKLDAIISGLGLLIAFLLSAIAAIVYTYYIMIGQLQAAVGLAVGLIAVALGFSEYTRKYFWAWFDYMVTASMYIVTSAIIANLVAAATGETIQKVAAVGTSTAAAGWKAASLSVLVLLISFEIPKLAGSLFGTGGGISGGAAASAAKGAMKLGKLF
ncbi:type IV secretion system protein [Cupriavidus sp. 8B]